MNQAQRRILIVGIALAALITLFPPWDANGFEGATEWLDHRLGHAILFAPPNVFPFRTRIAWDRLGLYWLAIAVLTTLGLILAGWLRGELKTTSDFLKRVGRFLAS